MAHGTPDWGQTAGTKTTYQLTDLAEAAVRLGSIDSHDRRGDVIFLDDFEAGAGRWRTIAYGTGSAAALSNVRSRSGQWSYLWTAGSDGVQAVIGDHYGPYPVLSKFGAEVSFHLLSAIDHFELHFYATDGVNMAEMGIRYDDVANELQYMDAGAVWVAIATQLNLNLNPTAFHTLKLVGDFVSDQYTRAILNDHTYDLGGIALRKTASAVAPYSQVRVILSGRAGQNDQAYVDDAILTQNEP